MASKLEKYQCPVCWEVPPGNIFQCQEGHFYCEDCFNGITNDKCPICRVDLILPIRNRALEDVIRDEVFDCKNDGCTKKLSSVSDFNYCWCKLHV